MTKYFGIFGAVLLFITITTPAHASLYVEPYATTTPQPFSVSCAPYTNVNEFPPAFLPNGYYEPTYWDGTCVYSIPTSGQRAELAIYEGTVGSSTLVLSDSYPFLNNSYTYPQTVVNQDSIYLPSTAPNQQYFFAEYVIGSTYNQAVADITNVDTYLRTGGTPPAGITLNILPWTWGNELGAPTYVDYNDSITDPQPFSVYCDPYTAPFTNGSYYKPQENSVCYYTLPAMQGSNDFLEVYKGVPGNAALVTSGNSSTPFRIPETYPNTFNGFQGDNYFFAAYGVNNQADLDQAHAYLESGAGQAPTSLNTLTWKWGTAPTTCTPGTLGCAAANLAEQLVHQNYLWGGKGYDVLSRQFVNTATVKSGYNYWNNGPLAFGNGVDCSGLVAWSYDRSNDPSKFFNNYIGEPNANGQYLYNMESTTTSPVGLQPGDLLFFDNLPKDGYIDHVAMYVGDQGGYDVVEAASIRLGIIPTKLQDAENRPSFVAFGRPKNFAMAMSVTKSSPVHMSVTEPDGNTISDSTATTTDEEYIRQSGDLTYATIGLDAGGYPEDVVYSPILKHGAYRVVVSPLPGTTPNQTYSLAFTAGSTTIALAQNVPLSQIPAGGYGIVVGPNNTPTLDLVPPEAQIGFSTTTKTIGTTGFDNLSTSTVVTNATSTIITDAAGNTLVLKLSQNTSQANYASMIIPSFTYSTGTTTANTTSLRYFWLTNKAGNYSLLVSAIRTPTLRLVSVYVPILNKTYVVESNSSDDTSDLSIQLSKLLLRKKLQTLPGMVVPHISTSQGSVSVGY